MYYIIYKTTNTVNGKIYIGYHTSKLLTDSYLGSGKLLCRAIKKYGKDKFVRENLFVFDTLELALKKERELVNEDFIACPNTYNTALGGYDGGVKFEKDFLFVRDASNNVLKVSTNDPLLLSGQYKHIGSHAGKLRVIHISTGKIKEIDKDLYDEFKSKGWQAWSKGYMRYKDPLGNSYYCQTSDPLVQLLGLTPWTTGMKVMKQNGTIVHVAKDHVTDDMVSIVKDTVTVKDINGTYLRVSKNDPRYINGDLVGVNRNKTGLANHLNNTRYNCEVCGKITNKGNYLRWHGTNCRKLPK